MLRRTLDSLARQSTSVPFSVVVIDNDPKGREGERVADDVFASGALRGYCVVEDEPGHCSASNAAFREAREFPSASYILMIDDDEVADERWVELMVAAAETWNVDLVGGPVLPEFPDEASRKHRRHPIYWPAFDRSGKVAMIYGSGNFLIRRAAFERLERPGFDPRYNFLGGGDTDFFTRCRRAGLTSYWENEARIFETVTQDRLDVGWMVRRGLRIGAINYRLDVSARPGLAGRLFVAAKSAALIPVSLARSLRLALRREPWLVCAHPSIVAVGRILAWLGIEPEQYRFNKSKAP